MIDIIMPTCNLYKNLTEITIAGINEMWVDRPKIIIVGYDKPDYDLPTNVEFVSMGVDETPRKWGKGMKKFFETYEKEIFLMWMDDHIPITKIVPERMQYLVDLMIENKSIDKIKTHPQIVKDGGKSKLFKDDLVRIYEYIGFYRLSLINGLWRTDFFQKEIRDDLSPWKFEVKLSLGKIYTVEENLNLVVSLMRNNIFNTKWSKRHPNGVLPDVEYTKKINEIAKRVGYNVE